MAFGLLTNKIYIFNDAQAWQPPLQYIHAIIYHSIGCNIINVINQLFFVYQGLVLELRVFVLLLIKSTKVANFIYTLEKKQKV